MKSAIDEATDTVCSIDEIQIGGTLGAQTAAETRIALRKVDDLHAHPSYVRHRLSVAASKLSAMAGMGDRAFHEPLVVTRTGEIIDGYARWELARLQHRPTLPCLMYDISESDALLLLVQRHRRSNTLNDFSRILLALDLEPSLKEQALSNQRAGGQKKGSSKLTKAEKLDVRSAIAAAAGVSAGNVSKVRDICERCAPDIQAALRAGEISIHRAWLWSDASLDKQREAFRLHRSKSGVTKVIRALIAQHRQRCLPDEIGVGDLLTLLSAIPSKGRGAVTVGVIDSPEKAIFLTSRLFEELT